MTFLPSVYFLRTSSRNLLMESRAGLFFPRSEVKTQVVLLSPSLITICTHNPESHSQSDPSRAVQSCVDCRLTRGGSGFDAPQVFSYMKDMTVGVIGKGHRASILRHVKDNVRAIAVPSLPVVLFPAAVHGDPALISFGRDLARRKLIHPISVGILQLRPHAGGIPAAFTA